jgi:hypothetical protein
MLLTKCVTVPLVSRQNSARLGREDDLRAEGAHGLASLGGQVLGHDEHHAVAADRCGHRERDAGVAARRFDQCVSGLDRPALLRAHDHRHRGPILDRPRGIVALELGEDDVGGFPRKALQPHQRRVADRIFDRLVGQLRIAIHASMISHGAAYQPPVAFRSSSSWRQ